MGIVKKIISSALCAALAVTAAANLPKTAAAEGKSMKVTINGTKAQTAENKLYRGAGMVSANNSSRLLLDYKAQNPKAYAQLLEYIFGESGVGINHLKIEMGADVNSSSGTEPNVMRQEDDTPDVTRGAGFQLAADAKAVNPDLTLDMLYWSEPLWVSEAEDEYAARYKWYKSLLDAAYDTYGLKFDYVSAVRNERAGDAEWVKYLSQHLKAETDGRYDYSQIKIVGGEEVTSWNMASKMLKDEELLEAVDVVGSHYTSWSSDDAKKLADEYGKELWFSEASSPMEYSGAFRLDKSGSGMADINGVLDVANRIITMYPGGYMTLYEYQPVVSAYYDGVTYCHKQLITANEPWSGAYTLDSGFFMSLHFSQFIKRGWAFVDGACYGDGKAGGDGHAIVDATYSYITAADTATGNYSFVATNTTAEPITYEFTVKELAGASKAVNVWETRGPDGDTADENYFKHIDTITPQENGGEYTFSYTLKPYSLVTLSTVELAEREYASVESEVLPLPYSDGYEYDFDLFARGGAPLYTTDEGGAFEVREVDGRNVLMQIVTPDIKSEEWGSTPSPETNFGDDRWLDYSVSVETKLAASDVPEENYTGVGLRYNLGDSGKSGWWLQVYENGDWKLKRNKRIKLEGNISGFDSAAWNTLKVEAIDKTVRAWVNGELIAEYESDEAMLSAGRAALYSSYNNNCFDNFTAQPAEGGETYVTRFDNSDACFTYDGAWEHNVMSSFKNYKRTISTGTEGAKLTVKFSGTGIGLTGENKDGGTISVEIDGVQVADAFETGGVGSRETAYFVRGLENGEHTLTLSVISGKFCCDAAEVTGGEVKLLSDKADDESAQATGEAQSAATADGAQTAESAESTQSGSASAKKFPVVPVAVGAGVVAAGAAAAVIIAKRRKK